MPEYHMCSVKPMLTKDGWLDTCCHSAQRSPSCLGIEFFRHGDSMSTLRDIAANLREISRGNADTLSRATEEFAQKIKQLDQPASEPSPASKPTSGRPSPSPV